ncbi:signal peptidase II [Roseisolibacter sp. H3M3-2]|uniref:signal peptidase II n=1 Tax=Roseisolibacter sp. H3M3-2 TaxID=3031323 RepID=UPI0023DBE721|nr:signal peptidase II [Roseisolibacter sp. H3M3-2]MDF1506353.1 signal peptidase II [Roseisolibacter sp. H3M3-2]
MATVLPFDPHARRRPAPPRPAASVPAAREERAERDERVIPLRVVRAADAPALETPAEPMPAIEARMATAVATATEAAPAETTDHALALRFFPLVLAVALADLSTKALALAALAERSIPVAGSVSLSLAHNTVSAGAGWLGASTRGANVAATGVVLGLLILLAPALHRLERRTTEALALMVGGGLGNLMSLATRPEGVPDFLRVEHATGAWVLNLADFCMLGGLAWLTATLVQALRATPAELPARARRLIPRPVAYRALRQVGS